MSRSSRRRRAASAAAGSAPEAPHPGQEDSAPPRPSLWLLAAFLVPNLGALSCGFVLDDLPLIVENERLHSLGRLGEVWTSGYWPDRTGLALYRPLAQTFWALVWALGGGRPWPFHLANLALGAAIPLVAHSLLRRLGLKPLEAFLAALLYALFPIHTEATTSVVGSAELLAGLLGLLATVAYVRAHRLVAIALFALAIVSKESAAAFGLVVGLILLLRPELRPARRLMVRDGLAATALVGLALWARTAVSAGRSFVPPIDNPMSLLDPFRRLLTALWVQVLYILKTFVPLTLSADYSYKEIPLVMGLHDVRAWAGLGLVAVAVALYRLRPELRLGIGLYALLFLPASNLLFSIGTILGERLAYLPSLGLAVGAAPALARFARVAARRKALATGLAFVGACYAGRTVARNLDWRDARTFYTRLLETSPDSAKARYFFGVLKAAEGDDIAAIASYDEAIAIFPAYSEAFHNRGNSLARLGRREEAMDSYRQCLRFDPAHLGAAQNLQALESGRPLSPPRRKL